ncbi:MAG TPA: twin-arginine translocase TatA/TatE family subunit [Bryobacteraceae bacterium]|nr:twin-arginine translocase TatA/TatE family subunit [Bryobacteraceae bacterium]
MTQILLVAAVAAIFFGGKKIGDLGKGLGDGIRNFKTAMKEDDTKGGKPLKEPDKLEAKKE